MARAREAELKVDKIATRVASGAIKRLRDRITHDEDERSEATDLAGAPLRPGQAAITMSNGARVGVFRDEHGSLHGVSAMCTHANWELDFDRSSKCWVCPRHGAQFSIDGAVLKGPALIPLAPAEISEDLCAALEGGLPAALRSAQG